MEGGPDPWRGTAPHSSPHVFAPQTLSPISSPPPQPSTPCRPCCLCSKLDALFKLL